MKQSGGLRNRKCAVVSRWKAGSAEAAFEAAPRVVAAFGHQQFGQECTHVVVRHAARLNGVSTEVGEPAVSDTFRSRCVPPYGAQSKAGPTRGNNDVADMRTER